MNKRDYFLAWAKRRDQDGGDMSGYSENEIEYESFLAGIEYARIYGCGEQPCESDELLRKTIWRET